MGGVVLGGLALACARLGDRDGKLWWPISRYGAAGLLRVAGVTDLVVDGGAHLEHAVSQGRGVVLMANHESLLDIAALMRPSPVPLAFVAKSELRRLPVFGTALEAMGHVFVDRRRTKGTEPNLHRAAPSLSERHGRLVVFPEGTRSVTGELLPFKRGGFHLALAAGAPIVPVGIAGTSAILSKADGWRGPGPIAVAFGPAIRTDSAGVSLDGVMTRARLAIATERDRAERLLGATGERSRRITEMPASGVVPTTKLGTEATTG